MIFALTRRGLVLTSSFVFVLWPCEGLFFFTKDRKVAMRFYVHPSFSLACAFNCSIALVFARGTKRGGT